MDSKIAKTLDVLQKRPGRYTSKKFIGRKARVENINTCLDILKAVGIAEKHEKNDEWRLPMDKIKAAIALIS